MSCEQTFLIINQYNKDGDYGLAVRGDKVVLTLSNPLDPYQLWIRKDTGSEDEEGQPTFALINKGSNEAIRHDGQTGPLGLVPYTVRSQDKALFWTESKNGVNGIKYIRRAGAISRHITANYHTVEDGRIVDLWYYTDITERWKFLPYIKEQPTTKQTVMISCRAKEGYNLTIRKDAVMLVPANSKDKNQIWIKDTSYGKQVKDEDKRPSFALVHRATGKAIKLGFGSGFLVHLAPFNRNVLDSSLLWTENEKDCGFREIRVQTNNSVVFHAFYVHEADSKKALLALRGRKDSNEQRWKFEEITMPDAEDGC